MARTTEASKGSRAASAIAICAFGLACCVGSAPADTALGQGTPRDTGWDRDSIRDVSKALVPVTAEVAGHTYEEWSMEWWKRAMALPYDRSWQPDTTGARCGEGQSGPVWFLAGSFASDDELVRNCTIPSGKYIFFPVIAVEMDSPCPAEVPFPDDRADPEPGMATAAEQQFLGEEAARFIHPVKALSVSVDGKDLGDLSAHRVVSRLFTFTGDPSLASKLDACVTGKAQPAVSDGYWVMLAPLAAGAHTIHFEGHSFFTQNMTYQINVE